MIICKPQLDEQELKQLETLTLDSQKVDGGLPSIYFHLLRQKRLAKSNVLYYQNEQLIAFVSAYFFYTNACELSLLVSPSSRRQGIARKLFNTILPLLRAKDMEHLIFSAPRLADNRWLKQLGCSYKNSEYHMERISYEPILITASKLQIRKAEVKDIPILCALDEACFASQPVDMVSRFQLLLNDSNYTLILAMRDEEPIGKAHIHWQEHSTALSDIAILPQYQGQGFGGEMLAYCINHALMQGKHHLNLDVETSNQNALNLYRRCDFKTSNVCDYWIIPLEKLSLHWEN